eukprot:Gregarina_sp_Pseudo_9__5925@NODE_946_length_2042_cov_91_067399_g887_i0_p2_GENE_NODE_946_length_2042_cov_91_067399_g887_i0NODE_946_length_2042_cov_91_067399_g887_i0_p2_ORF_typecomplete_len198_score4_30PdxJ/PF03740_13/0_24TFIIF_alpha/PF05793_12/1_2Podoplanin/PF05808_11/14_NODE_946_length_2042_cov_91_067399_g887_i010061599
MRVCRIVQAAVLLVCLDVRGLAQGIVSNITATPSAPWRPNVQVKLVASYNVECIPKGWLIQCLDLVTPVDATLVPTDSTDVLSDSDIDSLSNGTTDTPSSSTTDTPSNSSTDTPSSSTTPAPVGSSFEASLIFGESNECPDVGIDHYCNSIDADIDTAFIGSYIMANGRRPSGSSAPHLMYLGYSSLCVLVAAFVVY